MTALSTNPLTSETARSVLSFIQSIGVGAHIDSGSAQWTNTKVLLAELAYLGVSNVRDGTPFDYALPTFVALAKAGIHFDLMEANVYSSTSLGKVDAVLDVARAYQLELAVPGSVLSFEGTNEYTSNNYSLGGAASYGNLGWGLSDAAGLSGAVHANAAFANTMILAPSAIQLDSLPNFSAYVGGGNVHIYGDVGEQLQDKIIASVAYAQASAPGKPVFITETGISSSGYGTSDWGVTDEDTQAVIDLNAILDGFQAGASKTFVYELMDEPNAVNVQEQHFGLFRPDGNPKPAAVAIANLTHVLQDSGAGTATLGSLHYAIGGLPSTASSILLQKSDGAFDLIIWNGRAELYDGVHEVTPPTSAVTVSLGQVASSVEIFDPVKGATAQQTLANVSSVSVGLSTDPVIIQLRLAGSGGTQSSTGIANDPSVSSNSIVGGVGDDTLVAGATGPHTIFGGDGNDSISGGLAFDQINGNRGDDTIVGQSQVGDWLSGGQGSDLIDTTVSKASNLIAGNVGNDTLNGGDFGDTLRGGQGDDVIHGGSGADLIFGDLGSNTISGGAGADTFHSGSGGQDLITDFHQFEGDHLKISPGLTYTVSQVSGDVHVDLSNGEQIVLQNTQLSTLTDGWIVTG